MRTVVGGEGGVSWTKNEFYVEELYSYKTVYVRCIINSFKMGKCLSIYGLKAFLPRHLFATYLNALAFHSTTLNNREPSHINYTLTTLQPIERYPKIPRPRSRFKRFLQWKYRDSRPSGTYRYQQYNQTLHCRTLQLPPQHFPQLLRNEILYQFC